MAVMPFAAGPRDQADQGLFVTVNWLLPEVLDMDLVLALAVLEHTC